MRKVRTTGVALRPETIERLQRECSSVSAYIQALVDADTWRLDRAIERLRAAGALDEVEVLAESGGQISGSSIIAAASVVHEAARMGRRMVEP